MTSANPIRKIRIQPPFSIFSPMAYLQLSLLGNLHNPGDLRRTLQHAELHLRNMSRTASSRSVSTGSRNLLPLFTSDSLFHRSRGFGRHQSHFDFELFHQLVSA